MRVALYVHCFFPDHFYGTETYTLELAKNLVAMGHDPVVISAIFPGEEKRSSAITRYEYEGIPVYCLDKNYYPHTIRETYDQSSILEIHRQLLQEIKPDIIHVAHLANHTASLLEAVRQLGIPAVTTLTDFFGICFNQRLESADGTLCNGPDPERNNCLTCYLKAKTVSNGTRGIAWIGNQTSLLKAMAKFTRSTSRSIFLRRSKLAKLVEAIVERPDVLLKSYQTYSLAIAPTQFLKEKYETNGISIPLRVMHFGVDIPRHPKAARKDGAPIRFGYIGQIAHHKGIDLLLNAYAKLPANCAELYIYGSGDKDNSLSERRDFANPVSFKGTFPANQFADVMSGIDCLVIPSRWHENSPLVLLNSLATHTPVIVSDVKGMTEFVSDGVNGFVFSRGDDGDLTKVLLKTARSPQLLRKMSKTTEYSRTTRQMTQEVVEIYNSVLNAPSTA